MNYWPRTCQETLRPLKRVALLNPETLPESTDPDFEFDYVDIGNVTLDGGIVAREHMRFADSPSRARKPVRSGDVIISTVRTYLRAVASIGADADGCIASTGFAVIRPSEKAESRFILRVIQSNPFVENVVAESTGVSYPAITPSRLANLSVPFPDQETQKTIADFLDCETARIDQLIEKKERLVKLMEEKWNATLTNFTTKGLSGAKVVPSRNHWIRNIPEDWKVIRLKHLLANEGAAIKPGPFGSDLRSNEMEGDYATVINQRSVLDGDFSRRGVAVTKEKYEALRSFSVRGGDILLTSRGTIGRATIVAKNIDRAIIHPCVIRLRLNETKINPEYFLHLLNESAFLEQVLELSNATTIEVIYGNVLGEIYFPVPPIDEQRNIGFEIARASQLTKDAQKAINKSICHLREFRSALITAAVTGQIDVTTWSRRDSTDRRLDQIEEEMSA